MKRKILIMLLCMTFSMSLTACGDSSEQKNSNEKKVESSQVDTEGESEQEADSSENNKNNEDSDDSGVSNIGDAADQVVNPNDYFDSNKVSLITNGKEGKSYYVRIDTPEIDACESYKNACEEAGWIIDIDYKCGEDKPDDFTVYLHSEDGQWKLDLLGSLSTGWLDIICKPAK